MREDSYLEEQLILEFDFTVKIKSDEKNDFFYIKEKINRINYRYFTTRQKSYKQEVEFSNVPYLLVKQSFDKHFRFLGEGKAYLTNYNEKEGSFIQDFTILILQSALAYGGIRETIDYFADDLKFLFSNNLSGDFKTKVNYEEKRKIKRRNKNNERIISLLQQTERKVFMNRILIGFTLFFVISGITYILTNNDKQEYVTKSEFESTIKKDNSNPLKDTKIEVYINDTKKDSLK